MENFFKKRPRKTALVNLVEDEEEGSSSSKSPASKKKYSKHTSTNGFNQENINERVKKFMSRQPKGNWRNYQNSCRVAYTYLIQKWTVGESESVAEVYHFAPWGMRETISKRLAIPQVKANFSALPLTVKTTFGITAENFDKNKITVEINNTGYNAPQPFVRFYCNDCQKTFLPKLLNNPKYGNFQTLEDLISNWDENKIPADLLEIVGCFICSLDERVHIGPNKNSFFKDPSEHRKSYHPEIYFEDAAKCSTRQAERSKIIQKLLVTNTTDSSDTPILTLAKPAPSQASSSSTGDRQAVLTSKFNKKTKYRFIDNSFQKKLHVNERCESDLQKIAMGYCLSIVHVGVNKCLSEAAIIESYETSFRGIYDHCVVQADSFKEMYGEQVSSKITVAEPQAVSLNKDNIQKFEAVILKAYQRSDESKYSKIKQSKFWGIMHDGIQKFCVEYNGMMIQSYDPDTFDLLLLPFRLMQMKGGVDAHDTVSSLITAFAEFLDIKDNAFHSIRKFNGFEDVLSADIPVYFKVSVVEKVDNGEIHLTMSDRLPIANCGDGVSVNIKAARVLVEQYGFMCPDFRCSSHTVDGCWKRIARSETMCVEEVKSVYDNLKPVVKHFKLSSKSKEQLDSSMVVLEMCHGVHLMTWCATRMAHFVIACQKFDELLVPVYNTMFSMALKTEERDNLFKAENIYTLKLVSDLHSLMHNKLQRSVDKNDFLVSETYNMTRNTAQQVRNVKTPSADKFVASFYLDANGNLMFTEKIHDNEHTLRLTNTHKPTRGQTEDERLKTVTDKLKKIRAEVLTNIYDNLTDQVSDDSYYLPWSALDMSDKNSTIDDRISTLQPLVDLLCNPRTHQVQKYLDKKETKLGPLTWNGHSIILHYPAVLACTSETLIDEFKQAWLPVSRLYQKSHQDSRGKPNQRQVWKSFLLSPDSGIMYPNFCSLVMILLATPANTSPLERSYSQLEMICAPRRNHIKPDHLELLYLLKSLNVPVKRSAEYVDAVKLLSHDEH